ncbi:unnamed protein product [Rotaria socialis]|uniref:Uncharacterized protein n=1 Tax=Rotaria socialis TaxID=392032 RepID=A0A820CMN1_9BILA|nr:unnamed protein product [Rotaria socialis]CAF3525864.1 unnamed protein product [Rotaria socialis]CAF4216234.1 unnamed protein product [Rotaria socialis]CAF4351390.1 unnamed protein product [Rotaria socialis]CAF4490398.1 unnamed protein product [Rotaria socialis]
MSTSNKRFFHDDLSQQYSLNSNSTIKKRICTSLVPTVPRSVTNFTRKSTLNRRSISSDVKSNTNNSLFYGEEMTIDVNK